MMNHKNCDDDNGDGNNEKTMTPLLFLLAQPCLKRHGKLIVLKCNRYINIYLNDNKMTTTLSLENNRVKFGFIILIKECLNIFHKTS